MAACISVFAQSGKLLYVTTKVLCLIDFGLGALVIVVLLVDGPEKVWPHIVEGRSRVRERALAGAAKTPASKPAIASPITGA